MLLDCFKDLGFHDVVAHAAHFLARLKQPALIEFDIFHIRRAIYILDDIAFTVEFDLA